jgi:hypothetical protein
MADFLFRFAFIGFLASLKIRHRSTASYFLFVSFYSPLSPPVSEPLTNRGVLLSTLLQDILHPSHHLLNVLLQIANKLDLSNKKNLSCPFVPHAYISHFFCVEV